MYFGDVSLILIVNDIAIICRFFWKFHLHGVESSINDPFPPRNECWVPWGSCNAFCFWNRVPSCVLAILRRSTFLLYVPRAGLQMCVTVTGVQTLKHCDGVQSIDFGQLRGQFNASWKMWDGSMNNSQWIVNNSQKWLWSMLACGYANKLTEIELIQFLRNPRNKNWWDVTLGYKIEMWVIKVCLSHSNI